MIIENSFDLDADPDRVYAFLLDVHQVARCVRGAELTRVNDDGSYEGRIAMKVGPITAGYSGVARIVERDDDNRRAVLKAQGKETKGAGTASAIATMSVRSSDAGSRVTLRTEFEVAGRLAQFGRGIMEDVSAKMVRDLAANVQATLAEATHDGAAQQVQGPDALPDTRRVAVSATPRADARTSGRDSSLRVLPLVWTVVSGWFRRRFGR